MYPQFTDVGGNLGTTNSFTGVDIADLTGGVFNSANLLQGNNLFCFAYEFALNGEPDLLVDLLGEVGGAASTAILDLGCPKLSTINNAQLKKYPGYQKAPTKSSKVRQ